MKGPRSASSCRAAHAAQTAYSAALRARLRRCARLGFLFFALACPLRCPFRNEVLEHRERSLANADGWRLCPLLSLPISAVCFLPHRSGFTSEEANKWPCGPEEKTMSRIDIIRAWKDESYRQSLSDAERAQLPANPAGAVDLTAEEAATIEGQASAAICSSCHGCPVVRA
jgi:mersacidin/lichenicidin family type 2 lantibiotic